MNVVKIKQAKFEVYKNFKIYNPENREYFILFDKEGKKIIEDEQSKKLINIRQVYSFIDKVN